MVRLPLLLLALMVAMAGQLRAQTAAEDGPSPVISEILASNIGGLRDEDGDSPDWIEIHHPGSGALSLEGWWLTDSEGNLTPWRFPAVTLAPDARLVVLASGKNRTNASASLHTGFKLSADGGYLALVKPDGRTVASEMRYGPQRRNVSLGRARLLVPPWISEDASATLKVPIDDSDGFRWTGGEEPYGDAQWLPVRMGVGFDVSTADSGLVAYWDFDAVANGGIIADRSGHNHPGTLRSSSLTASGEGRSGAAGDRAVRFTGQGWMEVASAAQGMLDGATEHDTITISAWIRGDDTQPSNDSLFWAGSEGGGGGIRSLNAHLPWSDQVIYWDTAGCCDPGNHRISVAETEPSLWRGQWNHYAFVKRGEMKEIWQNGRLLHSGVNVAHLTTIRSLYLGSAGPGQGGYHGWIDDVAIWETALDPAAMAALARGASPLQIRRLSAWFKTDVEGSVRGRSASAYVRIPFVIEDLGALDFLQLRVRYDDGFVAYLNGREVARRNAPPTPAFNSTAVIGRPDAEVPIMEEIELPDPATWLHPGTNLMAFHALNRAADDPDFLLQVELTGGRSLGLRQFPEPTPGRPNGEGVDGYVLEPQVEPSRGFFENPVTVTISTGTANASLAYTTDGSVPSSIHGTVVASPSTTVRIARTTVLRAVAFQAGLATGDVVTHTYLFPDDVASQRRPADLPATWPGGAPTDFTLDSRVVNQALPGYSVREALLQIPTVSLVLPQQDLFGTQGIYSRPEGHGDTWEREASLEWVQPDGARTFQQNIALAIHGGISRDKGFTPKHGFRVSFTGKYGPGSLGQAILPDTPVLGFDRLLLRAGSTDTWPCVEWGQIVDGVQRWYRKEASGLRDQWVRDTQIAMGQPSAHGTYVNLYLNGFYWGLYNLCERPDNDFLALHLGGRGDDYDALADFAELHAGNADAWNRLMSLAGANLTSNANYQRLMGNRADGTRDPQLEVLLDVDNLIDYMILHIFIGADDWPNHNWWAGRRRGPESTGFKFFAWDQEISISSLIRQHSSWGPIYAEADAPNTPAYVYSRCRRNAEFRQRFADRVQRHLFGGGALSVSNNTARWASRVAGVDQAIVGESARWGDYQRPAKPYLREIEWLANDRWMRNTYFPSNQWVALKRFRDAGLYPRLSAPETSLAGGLVTPGTLVTWQNPNPSGQLLFTLDGSDPRLPGGTVSPLAQSYERPLVVQARTVVRMRVLDGAVWSALVEATYFVPTDFTALQLTELHYHPPDWNGLTGDQLEFLELQNTGPNTLTLDGLQFSSGVGFAFPPGSSLAPGSFGVLVRDPATFSARFPGVSPMGVFDGRLDNGGEALVLEHPQGITVFSVDYNDSLPWPPAADGFGLSLQRDDLTRPPGLAAAWVAAPPTPGGPLNPAQADSDGDGVADYWERLFRMDPLLADSDSDTDGDGRTALEEFLSGTDPGDASSALRLEAGSAGSDELELRFTAVSGHSYQIERRETLEPWGWRSYSRVTAPRATSEVRIPVPRPESDAYFRLITPAP